MSKIKKCNTLIYRFFFTYYIFFLIVATLHNDITFVWGSNNCETISQENPIKYYDPYMDNNAICQLGVFSSLLYFAEGTNDLLIGLTLKHVLSITVNNSKKSVYKAWNLSLRAPPSK
ncbi:MAG: hypothetical protein V1773_17980 [bacterium]